MAERASAAEVARAVADLLERNGFRYAIGGAIALGFYAPPRGTVDVDVNVFVSLDDELDRLVETLEQAGFIADDSPTRLRSRAVEDGQFRGVISGLRMDVFIPAVPFYAVLEGRRRSVTLLGAPIWILGPEDLVVLKLMFFRRKDLADVEALLRDQGASLDRDYVRRTLSDLVGSDDERLSALDSIERDVDTSG